MSKKITYVLAFLMLASMIIMAFLSLRGDTAIMDEVSHLPAGYSYVTQGDMRINPEHPPLIKDLAGLGALTWSKISGQPITFPYDIPAWTTLVNGQWDFGFDLMYNKGNNADAMLFAGRLPMLLVLLILGIYVFKWTNELFGKKAALLALFLYSFSPTFLAHGRFITTDVAAAAAIFISSYYFIRWLQGPSTKNIIIAGLVFGLAQMAKFSVFLIVPLFFAIALLWVIIRARDAKQADQKFWIALSRESFKYVGGTILLMAIGVIFILWPLYAFHVYNYPIARQQADTQEILKTFGNRLIADPIVYLSGVPVLRAFAQYGLGLAMVLQRAVGGNTAYFLGEVSRVGSPFYFPVVYFLKETLTLHLLTLLALLAGVYAFCRNKIFKPANFWKFLKNHIAEVLMLAFIALYWYSSLSSNLNIGVRHLLPTFAFIFVLISGLIINRLNIFWKIDRKETIVAYALLGALLAWQAISVVSVYPSFLAYFNESVGGATHGYKYVTDSNLDWGQDLKRLKNWTDQHKVEKIYTDFFGGATPQYYLGDKFIPWWGERSPKDLNENGGYLAVSATFLQGGRGAPVVGFDQPSGYYSWLNNFQPLTIIGHSIFVYYIPPNSFK